MDQLFLIKRYWASDEEDSTEENSNSKFNLSESKVSSKKLKLDILISNEDIGKYSLYNGKEKSQPSVIEINSKNDSEEDGDISDNELKSDSSLNDSDVNILDATGDFIPCESTKTKTDENIINTSNKIISKVVKDPKKSQQNNITSMSEKYDVMVNGSNLTKNINKNTGSKEGDSKIKTKKQTLNHSELLEDNKLKSPNHTAILENKTGSVNVKNRAKPKKIRTPELEESIKKTDPQEYDSNSQKTENIGQVFSTIGQIYQQKHEIVKHALPQWLCNPTYISVNLQEEETPISKLNYLDINTKTNLQNAGINFLFPVQQAVIPWLMQSKEQSLLIRPSDICVSAPTGSGKTFAFVLPIVQSLKDRIVCAIRALIVLPVSELAIQVFKVFETFIAGTDLKVALLTGKKSFVAEQNALVKSDGQSVQSLVDIVVTTPGRINDHIYRTKGFCLKRLRYLVIDEADRMMEEIQEGWLKQVEDSIFRDCIFSNCVCSSYKRTFYEPTSAHNFGFISQPLQKLLYSATLTHDPEQLHNLSLYKPKLFAATSVCSVKQHKGMSIIPPGLKMLKVICEEGIKPMIICHLVKHYSFKRVLCFTETVERAHRLHLVLEEMGLLQVREISSFNRAIQRKIVLEQFTFGKVNILVCSDLVARGIDVKNIDCVISYDVPQHVKTYIHRIGRTARAGKTGTAVTFLSAAEEPIFKKMLSPAGIKEPEKVYVNSEDLKPLIHSYQKALSIADVKLKKEKNHLSSRQSKKD